MRMLNENIFRFVASAPDLEGQAFWKIVYVRIGRSKKKIACDRHCPLDLLEVPVTLIPESNEQDDLRHDSHTRNCGTRRASCQRTGEFG